jgi:uncharacterized protein YoxC
MKKGHVVWVVLCIGALAGCSGREEELQKELDREKARLQGTSDSLNQVITQRDHYFDEVVRAINDVYVSLEGARQKEEMITQQTGEAEGKFSLTNDQERSRLLQQIASIDTTLKQGRKKLASLQSRVKKLNKESMALTETINNLKQMIEERERTIALLEGRVNGLENEVVEKTRLIAQRDSIIGSREDEINTVFYVVGTREELEEKGIITDEGGFPWGLFGSTTVLASGLDPSFFKSLDRTKSNVISVSGRIDEIVPKRDDRFYATHDVGDESSDLTVIDPAKFWQDRYLVIVRE